MERALKDMLIAGSSASLAVLFTNPLDVAKTRLQMQNELVKPGSNDVRHYKGPIDCIIKTFQSEGISGVQRGLFVAVIRDGSKCFFRIGAYEPILRYISTPEEGANPPAYKRVIASSASATTAALTCNPLDVVKTRVQASGALSTSHHSYGASIGIWSALRSIAVNEGVAGLWRGTWVNMIRSISFTAVMLPSNSIIKEELSSIGLINQGYLLNGLSAFIASFLGIIFMNPVDVIRTRIYNQPTHPKLYHGFLDATRKIGRIEGIAAFYKGAESHFLRVGPHTILTLVFIGEFKRILIANNMY